MLGALFAPTTGYIVTPTPTAAPAPSIPSTVRACRTNAVEMNLDAAKAAWLSKLDAPAWGPGSGAAPAAQPAYAPEPAAVAPRRVG